MQDDEFISPEEAEYNFDQLLERLENGHLILSDLLGRFWACPTDAGAKFLWLQYTKQKVSVPEEVIDRMIDIMEKDIKKRPQSRLLPEILPSAVFPLIHLVLSGKKENIAEFWEILHCSPGKVSMKKMLSIRSRISDDVLGAARKTFPVKRELKDIELFKFAANVLNLLDIEFGEKPEELARRRYKTYIKNI